ncbi:DUF6401 family natural product biosynthesis protein [Polymorphospora sp. NPDC051019]|uniref:DUF6401 family natural product biosynthesis protein n=1 Tax=Polymorphospora sp. NPDC051019 TaxID=3155725 RepID=UPI0034456A01
MTALFNGASARRANRSARSVLADLQVSVGVAGLAAAAAHPRLLASVDQHAAAVRDSLLGDRRPLTPVALAGYAEGVRDAALQHGWRLPQGPVDWSAGPDWVLTRLLAVCALARAADRPAVTPPAG